MDEFRKKYEYEEHKGVSGLIFLFFIMLILFEYALGIIVMLAEYSSIDIPSIIRALVKAGGMIYFAFTVFISIALFKLPRILIPCVRIYLVYRFICLLPPVIYNYLNALQDPEMTQTRMGTQGVIDTTVQCLVLPLIYVTVFSVLWLIYFSRSKHVKETYSNVTKAFKENY